jgi:tetratricopeptide (TPR) repeat protein
MKPITSTALALAVAAIAAPAAAQYGTPATQQQQPATQQAAPTVKPSAKAAKAILDLQDTVNKKDYASVPAKVAAAQAVATSKEDHYLIARYQLQAAAATQDVAGIAASIDTVAQSGYMTPTNAASLYSSLGDMYLDKKQYSQAAAVYQKAGLLDPKNAEIAHSLGLALYEGGQKAEAAATLQKAITAISATGQKPSEDMYTLAVQSAFDSHSPSVSELAREWLTAYPSANSWRNSITIYRALNNPDTESTLDLMRLLQATNALQTPSDYAAFIQDAAEQNNYNEAQAVLDAGIAAKKIDPSAGDFKELASVVRSKPNISAAELDAATKTAQTGMALLHIGDRYYAAGNYAKAAELYRMAQAKPDVDPNVAKLHIGMALARAGDKAGATAALNSVTGARADVAKFWLTYVNQRA